MRHFRRENCQRTGRPFTLTTNQDEKNLELSDEVFLLLEQIIFELAKNKLLIFWLPT
jgi:hypothetical protein